MHIYKLTIGAFGPLHTWSNRFSSTRRDTCFLSLWGRVVFQPQFWRCASWPPVVHHFLQACWTVRFDTRRNQVTSLSVWSLTHPNMVAPFWHILAFTPLNAISSYYKATYLFHVTVMITEQQPRLDLPLDAFATPYV